MYECYEESDLPSTVDMFESFNSTQKWVVFAIAVPLLIIYALALILTSYNLHEAKVRMHTIVLLRTQVMLLIIESFRLASALSCIAQMFSCWAGLSTVFDITMIAGQFMSLVFAMAICIHLSNVLLHIQSSEEPEREMIYQTK